MQPSSAVVRQLWRFLQTGAINTLFGYGLYALLVAGGLQLFVAQIVATIIAVAFNYVSYSRYVFAGVRPPKLRFLLSYGLNYLVSVAALAACAALLPSPYLAGLLATMAAAAVNFLVLRRWVFTPRADATAAEASCPLAAVSGGEMIKGPSCS